MTQMASHAVIICSNAAMITSACATRSLNKLFDPVESVGRMSGDGGETFLLSGRQLTDFMVVCRYDGQLADSILDKRLQAAVIDGIAYAGWP